MIDDDDDDVALYHHHRATPHGPPLFEVSVTASHSSTTPAHPTHFALPVALAPVFLWAARPPECCNTKNRAHEAGERVGAAPLSHLRPWMLLLRPARLALGRAHACRRLRARGGGEGGRRGQMAGGHRGADPIPPSLAPRLASSAAMRPDVAAVGGLTVERIPCLSDNYAWLLVDSATGAVAVVDPAEAGPVATAIDAR